LSFLVVQMATNRAMGVQEMKPASIPTPIRPEHITSESLRFQHSLERWATYPENLLSEPQLQKLDADFTRAFRATIWPLTDRVPYILFPLDDWRSRFAKTRIHLYDKKAGNWAVSRDLGTEEEVLTKLQWPKPGQGLSLDPEIRYM
jgi:hypothetical protein